MNSIFKLGINETRHPQVFYGNGQPWKLEKNAIADISWLSAADAVLRPIKNFFSEMDDKGIKRFYLQRTYSLGDVLMIAPVIRYLKQLGYDPYIRSTLRFCELFNSLGIDSEAVERVRTTDKYGVILDGTVERDHVVHKLRKCHRVFTYMNVLGISKFPKEVDWSCDLSKFDVLDDEFLNTPYIVFQGAGSTFRKQLPATTIEILIDKMNNDGIRIIYISDSSLFKNSDTEMTKFLHHKASVSQLFSIIGGAKAIICMDSSPLWVSHFVKTPVVPILGPTRKQERLSLHPLYPEGTEAIELNKELNCESCFECAHACSDNMSCLKIDPERIYELLKPKILKFWRT